jgi:hypothetical protein
MVWFAMYRFFEGEAKCRFMFLPKYGLMNTSFAL